MPRNQEVIRQWKLLHALEAARHGVSLDVLAHDLHVTTRTIRRDLAARVPCSDHQHAPAHERLGSHVLDAVAYGPAEAITPGNVRHPRVRHDPCGHHERAGLERSLQIQELPGARRKAGMEGREIPMARNIALASTQAEAEAFRSRR